MYFPAGVQLGWLVDPVNKFSKDQDGIVHWRGQSWYDRNNNTTIVDGMGILRSEFCISGIN